MSTPDLFDPYRKWLGIPSAEQPPHHYRLLGVGPFEDDADTIAIAADRQMAHLRTFQTGQHSALSQKLLNELAAARLTLLDPKKKSAYDQQLRTKLVSSTPVSGGAGEGRGAQAAAIPLQSPPHAPLPLAAGQGRAGASGGSTEVVVQDERPFVASTTPRLGRKRTRKDSTIWLGLAVAALVLAAVVYAVSDRSKSDPQARPVAVREPAVEPTQPEQETESETETTARELRTPEELGETSSSHSIRTGQDDVDGRDDTSHEPPPIKTKPDELADDAKQDRDSPTITSPSESVAIEKPRSLADLANIPDQPQLARARRETPPDGKSLIAATARFAQQYGKEIAAAKTSDARQKVAIRIWNEARDGSQAADLRYVMLDNVGKEQVALGNIGFAYRVANEVGRQFDVDAFALKLKALEAAAKTAQAPEAFAVGTLQALALADRAAAEGKLDVANKAAGQAGMFARKTKDKDLISQTDRRKVSLREHSVHNSSYKKALAELKKTSDNPEANLAAGKHELLVLGAWRDAIGKLAASGSALFAEVARLEAETRVDLSQCPPLAAAWWQAAEEEADDFYKPLCQLQAKYWHLRARKAGRAGGVPTEIAEKLKSVSGYPLSRLVPGTAARYYDGDNFRRQVIERADPAIDFFFWQGSPDPAVSTDFFSGRWTGFLKPPVSGRYLIVTHTDNSVRLWIDGKQVLNRWGPAVAGWQQAELELTDEPHPFRFEFNDTIGAAIATFGWSLAAFPDDQHSQWSPIDALYYDPDSPFDLPDLQ
jgi:hypothetical protein